MRLSFIDCAVPTFVHSARSATSLFFASGGWVHRDQNAARSRILLSQIASRDQDHACLHRLLEARSRVLHIAAPSVTRGNSARCQLPSSLLNAARRTLLLQTTLGRRPLPSRRRDRIAKRRQWPPCQRNHLALQIQIPCSRAVGDVALSVALGALLARAAREAARAARLAAALHVGRVLVALARRGPLGALLIRVAADTGVVRVRGHEMAELAGGAQALELLMELPRSKRLHAQSGRDWLRTPWHASTARQ